MPEAHKKGIRALVYCNIHWINPEFGRGNQDWLQVDSEGRMISDLRLRELSLRKLLMEELSLNGLEDMVAYDIDGVFLDGPILGEHETIVLEPYSTGP